MTDLLPYQLLPTAWLVGWTLVHFIWQAALVAAVASFALACVERRGSQTRYMVCVMSLACMAAAPLITLLVLATAPPVDVPSLALTTLVIAPDLRQRIALMVPGLTLLWVAGVWVMQVRIVAQLLGARALARTGLEPPGEPLRGMVRTLCSQLGLRHAVQAFQSTRATVPMVVGWLRPVVLVPTAAIAGLSTAQLRAVLAHELAHIKRHDALVNLVQTVFESLFFFHPAVWWLSNRLRVEREFCCDDVAVATCGDPLTYAKALAALDDARPARPAAVLAATGGSLMQRITRLLDTGRTSRRVGGWIAPMIMTLSLTAVVSAMSLTVDEDPDTSAALDGVDLVKVVAPVDGELAEILGILRQGGMDDASLLEFVTRLGTKPEVVDAIQGATEHAVIKAKHRAIKERMAVAHEAIKSDIEAGLITKEEASLRIQELQRQIEEAMDELNLPDRVEVDVSELKPGASMRQVEEMKQKLHLLHEDVAAGRKTSEEVGPIMGKLKRHIHELMLQQGDHAGESQKQGEVFVGRLTPTKLHHGEGIEVDVSPILVERGHPSSGTIKLQLVESDDSPGEWEIEPQVIEQVEPIESVETIHPVIRVGHVWSSDPGHVHEHGSEGHGTWSTGLQEAAIGSLHELLQSAHEAGRVGSDHLVRAYSVLAEMHADHEVDVDVALQPAGEDVNADHSVSYEWVAAPLEEIEVIEEPLVDDT